MIKNAGKPWGLKGFGREHINKCKIYLTVSKYMRKIVVDSMIHLRAHRINNRINILSIRLSSGEDIMKVVDYNSLRSPSMKKPSTCLSYN